MEIYVLEARDLSERQIGRTGHFEEHAVRYSPGRMPRQAPLEPFKA